MKRKLANNYCFVVAVPVLACAALWLIGSLPAQADYQERGRALYENQCKSCHEGWVHSRKTRKAVSLADLRSRTAAWSTHGGLDWSSEEIDDVVDYLNRRFYHFK